jgi:hypothetical protein
MPAGGGVDEAGGGPESMHDTTDGPRTAVEFHGVVKRFGDRSGTEVTSKLRQALTEAMAEVGM